MAIIRIPDILLPAVDDMSAWAVNACDQFTSDEKYWREVERITYGKPSTYNLIYPEIYLKDDTDGRIARINRTMNEYLSGGVFKPEKSGMILVERTTESGTRRGIMLAIDLEEYSFEKGAKTPVRSTEATILERIPPRVKIRRDAPLELPHVMLLYDDKDDSVLKTVERGKTLYDFKANMNGGRIVGTEIANSKQVEESFYSLLAPEILQKKYSSCDKLLFAVGDGNHSLATAKTCWEEIKKNLTEEEKLNHPARFALCEAVNIYDSALSFEPIHRLVKTEKVELFLNNLAICGDGEAYTVVNGVKKAVKFPSDVPQGIRLLDDYISAFIAQNGSEVDYIHGEDELKELSFKGVGIELPPICKDDFFRLIIRGGNLPRKTFSMGEGNEKRYYVEAKRIK